MSAQRSGQSPSGTHSQAETVATENKAATMGTESQAATVGTESQAATAGGAEGDEAGDDEAGDDEAGVDEADDDEAHADDATGVLKGYGRLHSRRIDLVGDYAGDELFLIDGDSLLRRCWHDGRLDFASGLPLLHAAWTVEHFLAQLARRKCHFHLVFFDGNRALCRPAGARERDAPKYYLARAAVIRHLQAHLPRLRPEIAIETFSSWHSGAFADYLCRTSPYFLMMHDGAHARGGGGSGGSDDPASSPATRADRVALRRMILAFVHRGFNIALVNGLEWRDTKVMTMILEGPRHRDTQPPRPLSPAPHPALPVLHVAELASQLPPHLTQRQRLAVLAVAAVSTSAQNTASAARLCAAFLLHQAILAHVALSARRLAPPARDQEAGDFLRALAAVAESILNSPDLPARTPGAADDLFDFADGRLFLAVLAQRPAITPEVKSTFEKLVNAVRAVSKTDLDVGQVADDHASHSLQSSSAVEIRKSSVRLLPFSNKVFDLHLQSVRLKIDSREAPETLAARKIFREATHWHNAKKPIVQRSVTAPDTVQEARKRARQDKRNQLFMAEMRTYAASLTNAVGKSLEPETVIVGLPKQNTIKSAPESPADSEASDSGSSVRDKGKPTGKKGGGGKTAAKNAGKRAMLNNIAAAKAKKDEGTGDKIHGAWQVACKGFEADRDPRGRYRKAKQYLTNLQPSWREILGTEGELYLVNCLLLVWIDACRRKEQSGRQQVAALIWNHAKTVARQSPLSKTIFKCLDRTEKTLKLPPLPPYSAGSADRKLAFEFALPATAESLAIALPSTEFQLLECGPYLERSFDSKPDPRVDFHPDGWQRKVLDTIDADKSAFVVAPTSAGKTFISFYAMRKVLEADDDGVLIYVAPTKALVNQIAAEVQARYSKKFKYGGKSVWAIHTRDYRINNPTGCQVLVTVPHVLQIMLLAPSHANSWSSRVKRIIFDEIHSIGQAEDGVVWEQLLLMSPCPIIALSATVGNPQEFSDWLATTQQAIGKELVTVQHPYRYSDLRKYFYVPPKSFGFYGLSRQKAFGSLGLEGLAGFNFVHPVAGLVDKTRGVPQDLALEPRDCFTLWKAMTEVQTNHHPVPKELDPRKALPEIVKKVDILSWEKGLKDLLKIWLVDSASPYDKLLQKLEQTFRDNQREEVYSTSPAAREKATLTIDSLVETSTLPLLCRLHEQDALPAIFFNYDRHECERICQWVTEQLQRAELDQVKSGKAWERTLESFEEYKKLKAKATARTAKATSKTTKLQGDEDDQTSKMDESRDGDASSKWESFDPDGPSEGYHFADYSKVLMSELDIVVRQLRKREIVQWLIDALARGIGVHHAGMNRKYRQVVEILFRKGFLRVIIATGTLALGINMPCKTVVFSGDSVFLTALNYRQCAGRAGRRGFDLLGNVVFQGVSRQKVCRLLSSRLPDLNGHFPITTTLVLRLFTLLHGSKGAKYAVNSINALLSQPRLYLGGASFKDQTMHHLRFSIEYLRRQRLLGSDGAPLHFAGLVSHLYFTENSSFAFHALLKEGYFHELCAGVNTNEKGTLETLMMVLAHLFGRIECRQADQEYCEKVVKPSSSIVFLPSMPQSASKILIEHNKQTLEVFRAYVETFVDQHIKDEDRTLPLTGLKAGAETTHTAGITSLPPSRIRSSFVALSGAGDDFDSIHDLCQTVRDGVFLEEAVVPHMDVYPEEMEVPLNAYLLDFFKHGDVHTLEKANRIRRADVWFLLNDFSLVLATIITSLMNFMKLTESTDLDMLEIVGNMDAHEEAQDDNVAATETPSEASGSGVAGSGVVLTDRTASNRTSSKVPTQTQSKNADSWEDLAGSDDDSDVEAAGEKAVGREADALAAELAAWDGDGGEGLKDVLKAFQKLHAEFTVKFKAMWA